LNLEDVVKGLGFTQQQNKGNKAYTSIRWERIAEYLTEFGFPPQVGEDGKFIFFDFIPENIFYKLCFKASNSTARKFQNLVTDKILPTIRKTGGYVGDEDLFVDTYLPYADENIKQLFKLNLITIRQLNNKIDYMKPLAAFAETVADSADTIDIGQLAKLAHDENIRIGRNRLFEWLRKQGFLRSNNEPYQQYMESGWFKVIEQPYNTAYGVKLNIKTLVTGRGQIAIIEKLKKEFYLAD